MRAPGRRPAPAHPWRHFPRRPCHAPARPAARSRPPPAHPTPARRLPTRTPARPRATPGRVHPRRPAGAPALSHRLLADRPCTSQGPGALRSASLLCEARSSLGTGGVRGPSTSGESGGRRGALDHPTSGEHDGLLARPPDDLNPDRQPAVLASRQRERGHPDEAGGQQEHEVRAVDLAVRRRGPGGGGRDDQVDVLCRLQVAVGEPVFSPTVSRIASARSSRGRRPRGPSSAE